MRDSFKLWCDSYIYIVIQPVIAASRAKQDKNEIYIFKMVDCWYAANENVLFSSSEIE